MTVKINTLEVENVKRIKAVALTPQSDGLTVIGGRNAQGKTSVLDAIAWALGGNKKKPSDAKREGSSTDPQLTLTLSNGIRVERKGKNGSLKVIDPEGRKGGQSLLDSFIGELALDLPRFMAMNDKEKARELLGILGIGEELAVLEQQEQTMYNQRQGIGQIRDQKRGAADELTVYPEAPIGIISASDLIMQQQAILARNGENQRQRAKLSILMGRREEITAQLGRIKEEIASLQRRYDALESEQLDTVGNIEIANRSVQELQDESTAELEESIHNIDVLNTKVRANQMHAQALQEAEELAEQYREISAQIAYVRRKKLDLLENADLPLEGLSVEDGSLLYSTKRWDCMSGSEQLQVATAIVQKLQPNCGFVLVDKLEQMDTQTLSEFGQWAQDQGLQVIATRVGTGDECSVIIEDGYSINQQETKAPEVNKWAI